MGLWNSFFSLFFMVIVGVQAHSVYYMEQGESIQSNEIKNKFEIFCYRGKPKYVIHAWQTVSLQIDMKGENYVLYDGPSPAHVEKERSESHASWGFTIFTWKQKRFKLDPFNQSCVGVESAEAYSIHLNIVRIDYWKVITLLVGLSLFLSAKKLSRNVAFYYLSGVSFGVAASFIILVYFLSKLFPRRPMMYGVVVCGWSIAIYFLQLIWENVRVIVVSYQTYVLWYAVITGLTSFIVCYRMGPVTNDRTLNIIQWSLQTVGLCCIFFSSELREASMGQICILLILYNIPQRKKKFPPKVEVLSNDQYYEQGVRETSKALDELRKYCSSPECNQWKTVLKLNEAKRFASFMEGQSHLSDNEILEYESSIQHTEFTDDEEFTDEEY